MHSQNHLLLPWAQFRQFKYNLLVNWKLLKMVSRMNTIPTYFFLIKICLNTFLTGRNAPEFCKISELHKLMLSKLWRKLKTKKTTLAFCIFFFIILINVLCFWKSVSILFWITTKARTFFRKKLLSISFLVKYLSNEILFKNFSNKLLNDLTHFKIKLWKWYFYINST